MIVEKPNDIFDKIHNDDFLQLLNVASKYKDIQVDKLYKSYLNHNDNLPDIYNKWEQSVLNNNPDYSLYGDDAYLNESFTCWKLYSRRYLKLLNKILNNFKDINRILDLGCGCAYSTIGLKALFPNATVIATNLSGTLQYSIDDDVLSNIDGCILVDESRTFELDTVDMIFASEFFEHLTEPIDWLVKLINSYNPKYIIFANTFTKMSLGHFISYEYNNIYYSGKDISRLFNATLRHNGYYKLETGFFNNRPQVFVREDDKKTLF